MHGGPRTLSIGFMANLLSFFRPRPGLFKVCRRGDIRALRSLIRLGVDIDARDSTRRTPLFLAAKYGHIEVMKELLRRGADIDAVDVNGRTALYSAVYSGSPDAVELLLNAGARTDVVDLLGSSAADYARAVWRPGVLSALGVDRAHSAAAHERQVSPSQPTPSK